MSGADRITTDLTTIHPRGRKTDASNLPVLCPNAIVLIRERAKRHPTFDIFRSSGNIFGPMRWLVHGNFTQSAIEAVRRHGHTVQTLDPMPVDPDELLKQAHQKQLDLMTTDKVLSHRLFENRQRFSRAIVYLQLSGGEVEQDDAIDRLFARYKSPKPGMLYTVTETRVKARQLPVS
ncbi:MAG: hypothetical protein KatS3mg104_0192 [Phycisphaerae bacterium]|nr:MAG: hypothetical protein KatS3mg104_0192 [Phycisphaerae bacterium]